MMFFNRFEDKPNMQASLQLKDQIPNAQFIVIEDAGQEINADSPQNLSAP